MQLRLVFLAQILLQNIVLAQPPNPGGGGPGGGSGSGGIGVSIAIVNGAADVPMGSEVTLEANHDPVPNPQYAWGKQCFDRAQWFPQPFHTKVITDCVASPAEMTYEALVNTAGPPADNGSSSQLITFHEPNEADTTIGDLLPYQIPFINDSPMVQQQIMQTTLRWDGQDLGPCADLCYRERVSVVVKKPFRAGPLKVIRFRHENWIPALCTKTHYGWSSNPGVATMNWSSPKLYDRNWLNWSFRMMKAIQSLPIGTVIAERQHQYQFDGSKCDGFLWGPFVYEVWLDLVIEQAKDANGNPRPIPNSNPTRYFKVAVWKVR